MVDQLESPVFLDFEASSLGKNSYPIEVAWVSANGVEESYLVAPLASWTDWAMEAQAIHQISRSELLARGTPVSDVAGRMMAALSGLSLHATAPSWDGQWLSKLLRGAGRPRHALRLSDSDMAHLDAASRILKAAGLAPGPLRHMAAEILAQARRAERALGIPAHRALADARRERDVWLDVRRRAMERVALLSAQTS